MEKSRTLYITDLDGTLLNNESKISSFSVNLLNDLISKGALISFATARTPATVNDLFRNVNINIPGIIMTGASLYNISNNKYISSEYLKKSVVKESVKLFIDHGINPFIYVWRPDNRLHAFHAENMNKGEQEFYYLRRNKQLKTFHLGENLSAEDWSHVLLIFCINKREKLIAIEPELSALIGYKASYYNDIFNADIGFLEVFAKGVDKAKAMNELKEITEADRVVAFGDNLNDISMLHASDLGVAVENAFSEVKEKAKIVIGTNNDDSVARFIESDFNFHNL